jgi:hypothetical protein
MKSLLIFLFVLICHFFTYIYSKEYSDCNIWQEELSSDSLKRIVDLHNEKRNIIATGDTKEIGGEKITNKVLPYATNMLQMYWNHQLAEQAQNWANSCKFEHSEMDSRKINNYPVGENLALEYRNYFQPSMNWERAINIWWAQQQEFLSSGASVDHFEKNNKDKIGAFTQMIWANSYMVGCGFAQFKDEDKYSNLYVCHYAPIGNIVGLPVYYSNSVKIYRCPPGTTTANEQYKGLCCPNRDGYCSKYIYTEKELIENTLPNVVKNYFEAKLKNKNKEG